ncbi:glycosyl hydrolase family 95 catalytic domain-containing protein [Niastella populi]|uniref:Trehalose hydrolase n=1 Tax=Niastella populi TaxID=550983 RepID=A0A1V9FBJ1_9BACT|nr:trehalose hydrolase [Niastella populi]OQP55769.1 trehalose hydrolase [Niastella populi]
MRYLVFCIVLLFTARITLAQPIYAGRYKTIFTAPPANVPTVKTPDAPLAGNGDIGVTFGGQPGKLQLFFGKNDFWRAYPVYPGGGIALPGGLDLAIDALKGAAYYAEQVPDKAIIHANFTKGPAKVTIDSWVAATRNTVVIEITANTTCTIQPTLWATEGNTSINNKGVTGNVTWATRSFENTPLLEWPCHVALAMRIPGNNGANDKIIVTPGEKKIITVTMYTNNDRSDWKTAAIEEAQSLTTAVIQHMYAEHLQWWRRFWQQSTVQIDDPVIEKYYYTSQYLFACASRAGKFAPGIWGPFITKDSAAWGGDYHLNYNYQAPYWAAYSSNHIELTHNYDQPLLDYMNKGKIHAKELLQVNGIYFPVGIGPKGLCTTRWPLTPEEMLARYGTTDNRIDSGYKFLGQKINAVFGAGNMLMRFYSTYDTEYAQRIYPYLIACAGFREDYLKLENGRYVIYMDHYYEVMPNLRNNGRWRHQLGDVNSTLSLGLVKMLFKGMIEVSTFLKKDLHRWARWQDIVNRLSPFPVGETGGRLSLQPVERSPVERLQQPTGLSRVSIHGLLLPGGVCGPVTDSAFNTILLNDVAHWKDRMQQKGEWGNTLNNGIETCFPAAVRVGYDADEILRQQKDRITVQSFPNGFITQGGGGMETLSAVPMTVNEMLLQSYEGVIRIFPNWNHNRDASFSKLRAYGAFLVSSSLRNGRIELVKLQSEKGRTCVIQNPWPGKTVQCIRNGKKTAILSGQRFSFDTKANETIILKAI